MRDVWQRLGQALPPTVTTAAEALMLSGLDDWSLTKAPLFAQTSDGRTLPVDDKVALLRNDNDLLGVVAPGYRITSNDALADFLDALVVLQPGATITAAGQLLGGREAFVALRWDDRSYVAVVNNYDGTRAPAVFWTMVQGNAVIDSRKYRIRSRPPTAADATEVFGALSGSSEVIDHVAGILREDKMDREQFKGFLADRFSAEASAPPVRQAAVARRNGHILQLFGAGATRWDAYVAACQWFDHHGETQAPAELREETRAYNAVFSPNWRARMLEALKQ